MEYNVFIGIDVSKEKLDFVVLDKGEKQFHLCVSNNKSGIQQFYKKLIKQMGADKTRFLFCLEHTGIYCNPFLEFASQKTLAIWLENAKKIKAYHGLERQKNDAIDAFRIAEYAYAKRHHTKLWEAPREVIGKLKNMIKLRDRLVKSKKRLLDPLREEKQFGSRTWAKEHKKLLQPVIAKIEKQIKEIEAQIKKIIREDDHLNKLYEQITSVTGVGIIVGSNTIVVTNEFKSIIEPKKMACHCGVAPFKKESGKSVKGRAKVSHQANKQMKSLLNMAARSAVGSKGELRDYYLRKVSEGKNKMSVLNAVRNKIIHRMFACVRDNRKYEKNYIHALA